jgi:hypothetical protein
MRELKKKSWGGNVPSKHFISRIVYVLTSHVYEILEFYWCPDRLCGLLERKWRGSGLENREYCRRDPSRWPRRTLYPQKLVLISPTSGGRSVGIVSLADSDHGLLLLALLLLFACPRRQTFPADLCRQRGESISAAGPPTGRFPLQPVIDHKSDGWQRMRVNWAWNKAGPLLLRLMFTKVCVERD